MVFEALELIRTELHNYIRLFSATASVELGSIANVAGTQMDKILVKQVKYEPSLW